MLLALALLGAAHGGAASEPFPLRPEVRESLAALQELWIDWLAQIRSGQVDAARVTVESLTSTAHGLGIRGLPELGAAAGLQAVALAQRGEREAARAAVDAAELLAPGRPEVAWSASAVARTQAEWLTAASWSGRWVARLVSEPTLERRLLLANLFHWALVVALLVALAFVGLEMVTRGSFLLLDLTEFIARSLPLPAAFALALALLVWPAFLPAGLLWLVLYWSVLLWGYGSRLEKVVMILVWVFLGALPLAVSEHARRLDFALSMQARAVDAALSRQYYGSLFSDLGSLREVLPDSVARRHLEADMHLRLGQWEAARALYREVQAAEPGNAAVLADLGACHFAEGNLDSAVRVLEDAVRAPGAPPEAYFNLSRALSELYRFSESESMLRQASQLDSAGVDRWMSRGDEVPIVVVGGGAARRSEILGALRGEWEGAARPGPMSGLWKRTLSLPLALVLVGPAVGVYLLSRRRHRRIASEMKPWFRGELERLRQTFMPGLPEAETERWGRAGLALVVVLGIVTLPWLGRYGFTLGAGHGEAASLFRFGPLAALAVYLVVRYLRLRRAAGGRARGG